MQNTCKNCNEPVNSNYCPNCGQPVKLKKIDKYYIIQEFGDFFFANKGMVYTVKNVFIRPGDSVKRFITEDRYRFVKPITFLFLVTLIYALAVHLFNINTDYMINVDFGEDITISPVVKWLMENPRYIITIMALFIAFWLKIFFRKAGYNFFEIFILMCFVTGISTLIDTIGAIIHKGTNWQLMQIAIFINLIYVIWAIGQFFGKKKVASYVKAFLSYTLGTLSLGILIAIITIITLLK